MSTADKANNKAEEVKGKVKETTGQAVGNDRLEAEGVADQTKGNLKQAGEKVKDAAKNLKPYPADGPGPPGFKPISASGVDRRLPGSWLPSWAAVQKEGISSWVSSCSFYYSPSFSAGSDSLFTSCGGSP